MPSKRFNPSLAQHNNKTERKREREKERGRGGRRKKRKKKMATVLAMQPSRLSMRTYRDTKGDFRHERKKYLTA